MFLITFIGGKCNAKPNTNNIREWFSLTNNKNFSIQQTEFHWKYKRAHCNHLYPLSKTNNSNNTN